MPLGELAKEFKLTSPTEALKMSFDLAPKYVELESKTEDLLKMMDQPKVFQAYLVKTAVESPKIFEERMLEIAPKREKALEKILDTLNKIQSVAQDWAENYKKTISEYLAKITDAYSEILQKAPKLTPDEKTQWARQLAFALMGIASFFHPGHSLYYFLAIPKVLEYWRNEDLANFEMAMNRFNAALQLGKLKIEHLSTLLEAEKKMLDLERETKIEPLRTQLEFLKSEYESFLKLDNELFKKYLEELVNLPKRLMDAYKVIDISEYRDMMLQLRQLAEERREADRQFRNYLMLQRLELSREKQEEKEKITATDRTRMMSHAEKFAQRINDFLANYKGEDLEKAVIEAQKMIATEARELDESKPGLGKVFKDYLMSVLKGQYAMNEGIDMLIRFEESLRSTSETIPSVLKKRETGISLTPLLERLGIWKR